MMRIVALLLGCYFAAIAVYEHGKSRTIIFREVTKYDVLSPLLPTLTNVTTLTSRSSSSSRHRAAHAASASRTDIDMTVGDSVASSLSSLPFSTPTVPRTSALADALKVNTSVMNMNITEYGTGAYNVSLRFTEFKKRPNIRYTVAPDAIFLNTTSSSSSSNSSVAASRGNDITLVTQIDSSRVGTLRELMRLWTGPISCAVFVRNDESVASIRANIDRAALAAGGDRRRTHGHGVRGFHLVQTVTRSKATMSSTYPINLLRNVAMRHARTDLVFVLDADFDAMPEHLNKMLTKHARTHMASAAANRHAFVVPAFEMAIPRPCDALVGIGKQEDSSVTSSSLMSSSSSSALSSSSKVVLTSAVTETQCDARGFPATKAALVATLAANATRRKY
jgi:hypothetical protein